MMLADLRSSLQAFVGVFTGVYGLLMLAHVLLSWLPFSLPPVRRFLHEVCEPTLRIFRRVIPTIGPLDLSPIAALIAIQLAGRLLSRLIDSIL